MEPALPGQGAAEAAADPPVCSSAVTAGGSTAAALRLQRLGNPGVPVAPVLARLCGSDRQKWLNFERIEAPIVGIRVARVAAN